MSTRISIILFQPQILLHLCLFRCFLFYYFLYRTIEVPSSRIVIIEGIYALSEKLRPLLDLRVSVTGGVHFDLVKRVLRDIHRAGQEPEEIIHQISETVFTDPMLVFRSVENLHNVRPIIFVSLCRYILCIKLILSQISKQHI